MWLLLILQLKSLALFTKETVELQISVLTHHNVKSVGGARRRNTTAHAHRAIKPGSDPGINNNNNIFIYGALFKAE